MKVKRNILLAMFVVSLLPGCGGAPETTTSDTTGGAAPAKKRAVIGMSQCNLGEPWRVQMNADVEKAAAAHPDIEVIFKDAQDDTLNQRAHIEEFVNQKVDVLICSPRESVPLTEPLKRAYEAGIHVIILDRAVQGDSFTQFIGADNKIIGEAAGRWVANNFPDGAKAVELKGLMTSTPGQDRNSGFRKGIEGSAVEVIFEADMQWLEPNARREMESALARFDRIDVVYGHNDPAAHGAWLAAKNAGREGAIKFVGIDGLPHEGLRYVREGILSVCFEYPTGGGQAIETALKLLAGETVPKNVVLPSRFFTPENIEGGGEWLPAPAAAS